MGRRLRTGVFVFVYVALVPYGKMLAQRWQREIESLRSMMDKTREWQEDVSRRPDAQ